MNTMRSSSHIEVVTENGFCIVRARELRMPRVDSASECHFIVATSFGGVRSVSVKFSEAAIAMAKDQRAATPLSPTDSFWLDCAERQLAAYVYANNGCPPNNLLMVESLSRQDLLLASRSPKVP